MSPDPAVSSASHRKLQIAAIALFIVAVLIVATGIVTRRSDAARLRDRADALSVPTVVIIAAGRAGAAATLDLPGRLEAYARAPLYARVSGYLKSWKADIGSAVKAGQLLAEIETPELDQQLLQARADLASATAGAALALTTATRWKALLGSDSVSRQEAEEKAGDLATKRAVVNASQANLDRFLATKKFARIVAPFDGIVTARSTDVGALINAGSGTGPELFVVSDTKKLRVYVSLPQNYVSVVQRGAAAKLSVPEHPGKFYTATVESSSRAINAASGSMLIQLAVDNAAAELLPGSYASVSFSLPGNVSTLSIPPSALIVGKSGLRVATVGANNKVTLKPVTIARDSGKIIELASGISTDDRIIESPPDGIADGDLVQIAASSAPSGAASGNGNRGN